MKNNIVGFDMLGNLIKLKQTNNINNELKLVLNK